MRYFCKQCNTGIPGCYLDFDEGIVMVNLNYETRIGLRFHDGRWEMELNGLGTGSWVTCCHEYVEKIHEQYLMDKAIEEEVLNE